MTFSILAHDPVTGDLGGAAATGSLCVGGWVLRGDPRSGMSACQGGAPSTFWGEDVLTLMRGGATAGTAVARVTGPDPERGWRQLTALDCWGRTGSHTGAQNNDWKGHLTFDGGIGSGNLLAGPQVLEAMVEAFGATIGPLHARLIAALRAAETSGGDVRGLKSAAMLVVGAGFAPLDLRVDLSDDPISALDRLRLRATSGDYAIWAAQVPCLDDPHRRLIDRDQ